MHRPAFRSVLERTTRSVIPSVSTVTPSSSIARPATAPPATTAHFSSTPAQSKLKDIFSPRWKRAAAAADEVGALSGSDNHDAAPSSERAAPAPRSQRSGGNGGGDSSHAPIMDARSLGVTRPPRGSNPAFSAEPAASSSSAEGTAAGAGGGGSSKIINVRSLPRRPSASGGSRSFPGPSGVSSAFTGSRFRNPDSSGGAPGGFKRRAGPGGRRSGGGGAGGRGGGRGGRGRRKNDGGDGDKDGGKSQAKRQLKAELKEMRMMNNWIDKRDMGKPVPFQPEVFSATTDTALAGYSPVMAGSSTNPAGSVAAALRAMRLLGGAQPFADDNPNPVASRDRLVEGKFAFFDTLGEREAVNRSLHSRAAHSRMLHAHIVKHTDQGWRRSMMRPASAATKKAIMDAAVRGVYKDPAATQSESAATDSLYETLQRYKAKDYTYTGEATRQLEAKLKTLVPDTKAKSAGGKQARA